MPRPRFAKLREDKRARILDVAADAFAADGYEAASYNRIIEDAGVSKGAMYYYFDDKEDLYGTAVQHALAELPAAAPPDVVDEQGFWRAVERYVGDMTAWLFEDPRRMALARDLALQLSRLPRVAAAVLPPTRAVTGRWLALGREVGAVRGDVPESLLVDVLLGIGRAADEWLAQHLDELGPDELGRLSAVVLEMMRDVARPRTV